MKNAIFLCFDKDYFIYAKACINSILKNYPNYPEIIVCYKSSTIDEELINFLRPIERLKFKIFDNTIHETFNNNIVYQKFSLFIDSYFDEYDKIIYLDCDTIVMKSLDDIFKKEEFFIVSNFENAPHINVFGNLRNEKINETLQNMYLVYPENEWSMCNAGMFMIPKKYRTSIYFNHLIKIERNFRDWIKYEDQSILTLWCQYFNIPISNEFKYNYQTTFDSLDFEKNDLSIIHFSGIKPDKKEFLKWNWINNHDSLKNLFENYLNK